MRFPISPIELLLVLPFLICLIAFVRFAKRSKQRQTIERAIKERTEPAKETQGTGHFANIWHATITPNKFFVYNAQRAPVLLIIGLLALISVIEALPQLILWGRIGLLINASSLLSSSGPGFIISSLNGFIGNFVFLLVMAFVIRFVAKLDGQAWIIAGYALSPSIVFGAINALVMLLAMISPKLTLASLLAAGFSLYEASPYLLGLVGILAAAAAMVWGFLPSLLSLFTFYAGLVAKAPEQAMKATIVYLILYFGLSIGAFLLLSFLQS